MAGAKDRIKERIKEATGVKPHNEPLTHNRAAPGDTDTEAEKQAYEEEKRKHSGG
jgi:hypothetical protein